MPANADALKTEAPLANFFKTIGHSFQLSSYSFFSLGMAGKKVHVLPVLIYRGTRLIQRSLSLVMTR
jgi:hypothetical protein